MGLIGALGTWLGSSGDARYTPLNSSPDREAAIPKGNTYPQRKGDRRILRVLSLIAGAILLLSLLLALA